MDNLDTIKIMLADDHALLRKGLASLLNSMDNITVLAEFDNGRELLEKLKISTELPDLCIIDINMPIMDGYATAHEIKKHYPKIKILALSMYDNEFNIIHMLKNGANGYLLKNASPSEMNKAIIQVMENGFYHSELVNARMLEIIQSEKNGKGLNITENEKQFLSYCCTEFTYKEIAEKMNRSPRTIDGYRDGLFIKLNITTRTGLVLYALKTGINPS